MLKIEVTAFENCILLKEFHFEKFDEIPDFKSKFNKGISNNYVIIVKDNLYDGWFKKNFEVRALKVSKYAKMQLNSSKKSKILMAYDLLNKSRCLVDNDISKIILAVMDQLKKNPIFNKTTINK